MDKKRLIKSVEKRMNGMVKLPHNASTIAYELFVLSYCFKQENDPEVKMLREVFLEKLKDWAFNDLLKRQVNYAIKLATANGRLEYEEMHKLLSLCDEIHALEYFGLYFDPILKQEYEEAVRNRFSNEKLKAKMTAIDKVEDWQKQFWWYKENLDF
ncbi:MAG: hypothetical protein AAF502_22530 [Bacteroidota bacterium]